MAMWLFTLYVWYFHVHILMPIPTRLQCVDVTCAWNLSHVFVVKCVWKFFIAQIPPLCVGSYVFSYTRVGKAISCSLPFVRLLVGFIPRWLNVYSNWQTDKHPTKWVRGILYVVNNDDTLKYVYVYRFVCMPECLT